MLLCYWSAGGIHRVIPTFWQLSLQQNWSRKRGGFDQGIVFIIFISRFLWFLKILSEDAIGGRKKRGEENLTKETPPKKGFWTPPSSGTFSTPLRCCPVFPVKESHDRADKAEKASCRETVIQKGVLESPFSSLPPIGLSLRMPEKLRTSGEHVHVAVHFRGRTNVQQLTCEMVWSFSFYCFWSLFVSLSSLWTKAVVKSLNSKRKSWRKSSEKLWKKCENVWRSAKKCEKVPRRFCPLVVAL